MPLLSFPRLSPPLLALAAASFAIGTTEFVIMGLLPDVARSFGVSVPQAGFLVSGYALGVVVGAPLVGAATAGLPRKSALVGLMAVFVLGNLGCAVAPGYALFLAARVLTAFAHGAFFGIGAVVARDLAPRGRQGQAVALMFTGMTLANVLGVPFGTALGQAAGWRATFWTVAGLSLAATVAIAVSVPAGLPGLRGRLRAEFRAVGRWPVLLPMLVSTLFSVSLFSVFTYITPFLESVTGLGQHGVTAALLVFGLGLTAGNLIGGRMADRSLTLAIVGGFIGVVLSLLALWLLGRSEIGTMAMLGAWGIVTFGLVSPLQTWVVEAAHEAPNLASTLNQGAFNLGNALGAWIGGAAVSAGFGYAALPVLGAALAAVALGTALSGSARPKALAAAQPGD